MPASIIWNRKPLPDNLLSPLPPTAFQPSGWLRERLEAEAPQDAYGKLLRACMLRDDAEMDKAQGALSALARSEQAPTDDEIRALIGYFGICADKAAPLFLLRYARSLRDALQEGERFAPAQAANVADLLYMALWLYNLTGQKVLLDLCDAIKGQAPDWMSTLHIFPQTRAVGDVPDMDTDAYWRVHGPTIAASLRTPALQALFEGGLKNETAFSVGWEKLMRHHGAAHGLFNADPLLAGANPSCGVCPQAVTEMVYTLSMLLWTQGDPASADLLERIVYGALQAAQGTQAANQLVPGEGALPGGWTTFASAMWMATPDEGLACVAYGPGEVRWRINGRLVRITTDTKYPYEDTVCFTVRTKHDVAFPLRLRIPAWAQGATVTVGEETIACEPGTFAVIDRTWHMDDVVALRLPMETTTHQRFHQTVSISRGPLTYALSVEEGTPWNLALLPDPAFETGTEAGIPVLYTDAALVEDWRRSGDAPASPPIQPVVRKNTIRRVTLVPYGETKARIAQFPVGQPEA